jgi:hypothetical protein
MSAPQEPRPRSRDEAKEHIQSEEPGVESKPRRRKSEAEMSRGKNYPHSEPGARLEYDPTTRRTPQGGGPD